MTALASVPTDDLGQFGYLAQGGMEGDGRPGDRSEAPRVFADECGANISLVPRFNEYRSTPKPAL
jgi:hypothetical protein